MIFDYIYSSPLGNLGLIFNQSYLKALHILENQTVEYNAPHPIANTIISDLDAYFKNPTHIFTCAIKPEGTSFQIKVWEALRALPAGKTDTYGELARQLQTSPRAIGQALKKNPIPIVLPCHRIISKIDLGGYMGKSKHHLAIKKWLLNHEMGPRSLYNGKNENKKSRYEYKTN